MLRPVVVGLDGSRESLAAADWAAREALLRGLPLRLVHAWQAWSPEESYLPELDAPLFWARRILRDAMDWISERHPRLYLSAEQISLPASEALVSAGAEAELLVLGSRAFRGFGGFMAGSVTLPTVARVRRPVVLVRADETAGAEHMPDADGRPAADGPYREIVVGVDAAHPCEEMLAFAFESAALRSASLRAVHSSHPAPAHGHVPGPAAGKTEAAARAAAEAEQALASALRPWREKYPGVTVRELVESVRPAQLLLNAAAGAGLLVVGRRIRPIGLGNHTGPVAHAVMHHVRCPVAVVPHE